MTLQLQRQAVPSTTSEVATATPFEAAVSRREEEDERQDFDRDFDESPRIELEEEDTQMFKNVIHDNHIEHIAHNNVE